MLIDAIDIWRTILAFVLTASGAYMVVIYRGLKRTNSEYREEVGLFCIATLIGGFTFFVEVLAGL